MRLPVRWSGHAQTEAPFTIDPVFFKRVDWAVEQALTNDLAIVVDMHHYEEMALDAAGHIKGYVLNGPHPGQFSLVRSDDFDTRWVGTFEANVQSVARLCLLARPHLAASGDGAIVNIASIYGRESGGGPEYNAMKSAEIALSILAEISQEQHGGTGQPLSRNRPPAVSDPRQVE